MGKMKNIKIPIYAIDFEGSKNIGIVEYGIAEITGGQISACKTRICAPKSRIGARDAKFFDISNARASANPPFESDLKLFCNMRKSGLFASHNATAEDTLLRDCLPAAPLSQNPLTGKAGAAWGPYIDTCSLAKKLFNLNSAKLADVTAALNLQSQLAQKAAEFCPEDRRKWHCALFDAIACALILIKICSFEGFEEVDCNWLLKYSNARAQTQGSLL